MLEALRRLGAVIVVTAAVFTISACGGERPDPPPTPTSTPTTPRDPETYGDSPRLDVLWEACASDDGSACDELYQQSPEGSDYQRFGDTCGGRTEGGESCSGDVATSTPTTPRDPWTYGDSPRLDVLWEACASDDASACDELYQQSPEGSDYERFGDTCGGRTEGGELCSSDVPTPTTEPGAQSLITDLVGQPVDGAMVGELLDTYDCEIDGVYVAHYKCLADGIELSVDSALNISSVFLFAEGVADYGEFTGSMPYGLYWGASWSEIEAAWGPPASQFEFDPRFTVVYEGLYENYSTVTLEFTADTRQLVQATFTA